MGAHDMRDKVVDFLNRYRLLTGIAHMRLLGWLGLSPRKFNHWQDRYGKANEHKPWCLATIGWRRGKDGHRGLCQAISAGRVSPALPS